MSSLHPLRVLDEATARKIHQEALEILSAKGVKVESKKLRDRLAEGKALVKEKDRVVCFPADLVRDALESAPREFILHGLKGNPVRMAPGQRHLGTYTEAPNILDYGAPRYRPSRLSDLVDCLKIAEGMEEVVETGGVCVPTDLPEPQSTFETIRAVFGTTQKIYYPAPHNGFMARTWADAARAVMDETAGDRTLPLCCFISTTSPFLMDADSAEVLMVCSEMGIPFIADAAPMAGGTSPYTLAGTVLLQTAETLFLITARHILNPRLPVMSGGSPANLDMRTAQASYGSIERRLINLAMLDVCRLWGIPAFAPANSVDSCQADAQIGAEKCWTYLTAMMSDPCASIGVGAVTNGRAVSLEQMVIDLDLIHCAQRFMRGVRADEAARAKEVLLRVPHGGDFLTDEHTMAFLRTGEYYDPVLFNRSGPDGKPIAERAHEKVEEMLAAYRCPVPRARRERLDRYLAARQRELRESRL